jgi:murein L,D-transpeptidase YcbB/YkuD
MVRKHGTKLVTQLWLSALLCSVSAVALADTSDASATLAAALRGARGALPGMHAANEETALQALYARLQYQPLWSDRGRITNQGSQLVDALAAVDADGLRPSDYGADLFAAQRTRLASAVDFDLMLSRAAIRLITHLHYGRVDPHAAGFELPEPRSDLDVPGAVIALASAPRVSDALAAVEPHFYHYGLLKQALARYRGLATDPTLTQLPALGRRAIHAGEGYMGAPALRRLLTALGELPPTPNTTADAATLDGALVQALQHYQGGHGLTPDGSLGADTYAALTTPLAQRVRQIELTLERWRWLPPFEQPPIIVNIPQFMLFAFETTEDRGAAVKGMSVIVGKTYTRTRTPVFVGKITHVIFRPFWDIPRDIMLREMLPAIRANGGYLERNHLELVDGASDASPVVSPSPDALAALSAGRLRLRQKPGDDNSLGLIKFIFPNTYNVYLHATPVHRLFLQPKRAFSHGCIRVSDPVALARYVLRNEPGVWDEEHIIAAMQGADSSRVELQSPVPVMVLYATALATEAGPVQFFADLYGHDARLQSLLDRQPR